MFLYESRDYFGDGIKGSGEAHRRAGHIALYLDVQSSAPYRGSLVGNWLSKTSRLLPHLTLGIHGTR